MPFLRLIARILTFRDKKSAVFWRFATKQSHIWLFCNKTMLRHAKDVRPASLFVISLPNAQLHLMPACDISSIWNNNKFVDSMTVFLNKASLVKRRKNEQPWLFFICPWSSILTALFVTSWWFWMCQEGRIGGNFNFIYCCASLFEQLSNKEPRVQ